MSTLRMHTARTETRRATDRKPFPGAWGKRAQLVGGVLILAAVGVVGATAISTSIGNIRTAQLPAGTQLTGKLDHTITTENGRAGQTFEVRTTEPVALETGAEIPSGVVVRGEVTHTKGGGRIAGAPELTLRFTSMEIGNRTYSIQAQPFRLRGKNDALESVAEIGGGALVGGIVGAVAGDAVKGAVVGGVAGTGVAVVTKGNQIVLPAGQKLRVRLAAPVTVKYSGKAPSSS